MVVNPTHAVPTHEGDSVRFRGPFLTLPFRSDSLAFQFFAVGGLVSLVAMVLIGMVVTSLIERAVTRNAAATTALYVDSVIAPLLPDMQTHSTLDDVVQRALDETLGQGALGGRLAAMRLWRRDGTVLYAEDDTLIGRRFEPTPGLKRAFTGEMVANYNRFDEIDNGSGRPAGPLLEIYNPILQPWSGEVVAVIEFYEHAQDLEAALANARLRSWLAIAAATAVFFLVLSIIVFRGSRTIDRQAHELKDKVAELTALHQRVKGATQRATSLNERFLRRLGADLHDGPAQLVALASLRLDSGLVQTSSTGGDAREQELQSIRANLEEALQEIRSICHGLVLPHIETEGLSEVVNRAIDAYERRTGTRVERRLEDVSCNIPLSQRICVYRFLQEALNNGFRHCRGASQIVSMAVDEQRLSISVSDDGQGFDPEKLPADNIGIAGMRERIEILGGSFVLESSGAGTTVMMTLDIEEAAER